MPEPEDGLGVDALILEPETVEDVIQNMLIYEHNMLIYSEYAASLYQVLVDLRDANEEFNS